MGKQKDRQAAERSTMDFLLDRVDQEREQYDNLKNRRATTAMAREGLFLEQLGEIFQATFAGKTFKAGGYAKKKSRKTISRIANIALSDLHFHSLLDPREVPLAYGPIEETRRFGKIVSEVCDYKSQYRDNTTLRAHVFGDLMQGMLHDPRDAATLTEQVGAVTYYLIQAAKVFAEHFPQVIFTCVPGNHGRNKGRHHDRATFQKWDSFENMVYMAFKFGVATLPNVTVEIPYTPYYTYKAFDKTGFVTHGDTVINAGFPSDTINIKSIRNQINEWNAGDETYDLFLVGHVHCGSIVQIPSGPVFMSNGPLVPPDPFAISRGSSHAKCGQWLWESVEGHISGDARYLDVNELTDKDESLDGIILPFVGFETESPFRKK